MGRSKESFQKREVRKKKEKRKKDKAEKKKEKRESNDQTSFDDMIAYVDDYGNITNEPPDPEEKEEIAADDIELSATKEEDENNDEKKGIVDFFNDDKGFGFIKEVKTKQSVFVHINNLTEPVKGNNMVTFTQVKGEKGPMAMNVKLAK